MSSESETRNSADAQPLAPPVPPANPPVSLESERRKAMMLVHGVEKDVHRFREIYLQNYHNPLSSDIEEFLVFVAERSETRRPPRTQEDFVRLLESVQDTAQLEFPNELHHVSVAMERVRCFHDLMTSVESRLKAALDNHVGRYCHAFSAEAEGHDIPCVLEYENSIVSWRSAVGQAFALLQDVIASVVEASISFENLVLNHDKVLQGMRRALEVLQRIYAPLKDWVSADEAYVRKLQDEAHGLLRRKVAVLEKTRRQSSQADTMKTKVARTNHETVKLKERVDQAEDEFHSTRRHEMELADSAAQVEMEMANKRQELQGLERQFLTRQFNSEARDRRLMAQSAALHQELDTLRKRLDATHMKAERARRQRLLVQREVHKLKHHHTHTHRYMDTHSPFPVASDPHPFHQTLHERSIQAVLVASDDAEFKSHDVHELQEAVRVISQKLTAVRRIHALKTRPDILRRLYREGYTPGRQLTIIAIMMDSQRRYMGLRGAAQRSLAKWRHLSRAASVDQLVHTLRTINKQAVASRIERRVSSISV
ncbi:uncharacterized protein LOC112562633 isoform X3 [Pomacea canaliculata]|uniref:uncharacterized protein LOC112562633 isoform X3 n=1 Tax=Pomacea canaliculata TaxID=400727 RepID=UPI000D73E90A|nr:uncharacterized protein LOC112562633 isoform X3 [Pomacea canaliculata]